MSFLHPSPPPHLLNAKMFKCSMLREISLRFSGLVYLYALCQSSLELLGFCFLNFCWKFFLHHIYRPFKEGLFIMGHQQEVLYHSCFTEQSSADFVKQEWEVFLLPKKWCISFDLPFNFKILFRYSKGIFTVFLRYSAV
jgi:hypothetical protein